MTNRADLNERAQRVLKEWDDYRATGHAKKIIRGLLDVISADAAWFYNQGYLQGHKDTVEGGYTHIHPEDMNEYHADIVAELLNERETHDD